MKKMLSVVLVMLASVMSTQAEITVQLLNQTVNGNPVPYPIGCGGILSFATTDVYEADVLTTTTSGSSVEVVLNIITSPHTPGLVSTVPLPVSGFGQTQTHIVFYSEAIYFGNFRIIASDELGNTTYCDLSVDWPEPVELASFVSTIHDNDVILNWTTSTETNNEKFEIERSRMNSEWLKIGSVAGSGNSNSSINYTFEDKNLSSGSYSYRLKQIDFNGNYEYYNLNNEINIGIPVKFSLSQNYPNPFNPSTTINYDLPFDGKVTLKVFDVSGREVSTLINEFKTAGYYAVSFNGNALSSGIYIYTLSADNIALTKKMLLIKKSAEIIFQLMSGLCD